MSEQPPTPAPGGRLHKALLVAGIVVLAFNLRPAAVSVGPVIKELSHGLGMGAAEAGALTALPVLCFAAVGGITPRLARALGAHRLTLLALLLLTAALATRALADQAWLFLVLSFLALSGMATANVLLPSLVKLHFPGQVGRFTAVYSMALATGLTAASVLTVPVAQAGGGMHWRRGLLVWALTAAVAALPWLGLLRHDRHERARHHRFGAADVARTRLGWAMALFFGLQSLQAYSVFGWFAELYREAGFSAHTAGLLLGVITAVSIPFSWVVPNLAARVPDPRWLLSALMACYPVGYVGLLLAPAAGAWVWAVLVGLGACTFPLALTLIGLRARTPAGTAVLSGFTQSVGYLIAVAGPFGVGVLHDASGGWTVPLLVLLAICVPQYLCGLAAARPRYLEDELGHGPGSGGIPVTR
ncbi:MAG: CynX/NimT family MFS transporter [Marmoricola sp.]